MAKVISYPFYDDEGVLVHRIRMLTCSKCGYFPLETSIDYCRSCLSKQHFTKKQLEEFEL